MRIRICFAIISLLFTSTVLSALPPYIDKDTFTKICRNVSCPEGFNPKYISTYFHKPFHKALALSVYKSGNKYIINHVSWSYQYKSYNEAKRAAFNGCLKKSNNCEMFLVNNSYVNESLYNKLIKSSSSNNKIPANAYKSGNSWKCFSSYYKNNNSCVELPSNAIARKNSDGFNCKTGYKKSGSRCIKPVSIPANSHANGNSWTCNTSYYKDGSICRSVPANAYSNYNSNFWNCSTGYSKSGNSCVKNITIPQNSHKSGTSWICNTNYYRNNAKTRCLYVPANSTSSYSSNVFKCNTGYSKSGNSCVKKSPNAWEILKEKAHNLQDQFRQ